MSLPKILVIAGPTASGKSARAVAEALARGGEIISVDSRQVYWGLDIGTEKITKEEMKGIPHYLIDIRDANESYSAGDFVNDAERLIADISARGKLPILAGGTHFYFDALLKGLPGAPVNEVLRAELEKSSNEELYSKLEKLDPRRAQELDPKNRRRLIRALEIIDSKGVVPERAVASPRYETEWILIDPPKDELRKRIDARLETALTRGLIEEVGRVRSEVGDARINELGLEYKIVGEYLRGELSKEKLLSTLSSKLAQYARRQRAWLRKLRDELIAAKQ